MFYCKDFVRLFNPQPTWRPNTRTSQQLEMKAVKRRRMKVEVKLLQLNRLLLDFIHPSLLAQSLGQT